MRLRSRLLTGAAVLAIAGGAVAGCSSDGGDDGGSATTPTAATTDTGTTTATATTGTADRDATVRMSGVSFIPDAVRIVTGGRVTFENTSKLSHNVTFDDISSGTLKVGDSYQRNFVEAGTFSFVCTFHAGMKGTVTVD